MTLVRLFTFCCCVVFLGVLGLSARASELPTLTLTEDQVAYSLYGAKYSNGFFVPPDNITVESIQSIIHHGVAPTSLYSHLKFSEHKALALYASISNQTVSTEWIFHLGMYLVDKVDVYLVTDNVLSVFSFDFTNRGAPEAFNNVLGRGLPIALQPGKHTHIFAVFSASSRVQPLGISLVQSNEYYKLTKSANSLFHIPLGTIVGIVLTAFIAYILLRDSALLWFVISSLLLLFITILRSHLGLDFLQPQNNIPPWAWVLTGVTQICMLKFVASFLSSDNDPPVIRKLITSFVITACLLMLVSPFLSQSINTGILILMGVILSIFSILWSLYKTRHEGGFYIIFALGWLPIFVFTVEFLLLRFSQVGAQIPPFSYTRAHAPLFQAAHLFIHLIAIFVRVAELKKHKLRAEARSLAKTMFLASVSHDLRQPVHTMRLLTSHLDSEVTSTQGKVLLKKLDCAQGSLEETFGALMDWSQLEAGEVKVNFERVSIDEVLGSIQLEFTSLAELKGLKLTVRNCQLGLTTDPLLLKRILRNLLSNAIKYTEAGGILVACRCRKSRLVIEVWDTGQGIDVEDQSAIFDVYRRVKGNGETSSSHGVGLANVKLLIDKLGYEIEVRSQPNRGSVFRVCIPSNLITTKELSLQVDDSKTLISIISCIEDTGLAARVERYLKDWGYPNTKLSHSDKMIEEKVCLTDDPSFITERLDSASKGAEAKQIFGFFSNTQQQFPELSSKNVHVLRPDLEPAELRAFLRYAESLQMS